MKEARGRAHNTLLVELGIASITGPREAPLEFGAQVCLLYELGHRAPDAKEIRLRLHGPISVLVASETRQATEEPISGWRVVGEGARIADLQTLAARERPLEIVELALEQARQSSRCYASSLADEIESKELTIDSTPRVGLAQHEVDSQYGRVVPIRGEDLDRHSEVEGTSAQNYHRCTIHGGFLVGTEKDPLDFARLAGREFHVDPLPKRGARADKLDDDALAFHTYLLGHDPVADHRICFTTRDNTRAFWIAWEGRIALTYGGQQAFKYGFKIPLRRATFGGIAIPKLREPAARKLLARFVAAPESFVVSKTRKGRRFQPA